MIEIEEKIKKEKRRRNQIYTSLDYFLSNVTYFDFFSFDAFKIAIFSKSLASFYKETLVQPELLLLPFFYSKNELTTFLKEINLPREYILPLILGSKYKKNKFFNPFGFITQKFRINSVLDQKCEFSNEVNFIFEKATENSLIRFKSPIISSNILLITMMEETTTKTHFILKKALKNEMNWYLLRYKLIKQIHYEESNLRGEILKNQHYFAYLFKSQTTEKEFNRLIDQELLPKAVSFFRNRVVSSLLEKNFFDLLAKDIKDSIVLTNQRTYLS